MSNAARLANANRDTAVSPKPSSAHRRGSLGGNGQPFPSAAAAATAASVAATAAAAASAPAGPMGAKARKAARDAEERAAREQAAEEMSAHSYNEMLKKLLSKEIAAREASEAKSAESAAALERFKTTELDALRAAHQAALAAQAESLSQRARVAFDADIEAAVAERVAAARALDSAKLATQAELQQKLHAEFEDKYAQKLQREQREKKELSERLYTALSRNDALQAEVKSLASAISTRDGTVSALEHRVASLEKMQPQLRSYRTLVKYMCCRIFVNTVRLKRGLRLVFESLRVLSAKLAENAEYDRSSGIILPQHELEEWIARVAPMVSRPKHHGSTPMGGFVAAMSAAGGGGGGGGGGGSNAAPGGASAGGKDGLANNIHPNTIALHPHFQSTPAETSSSAASTAAAAVEAFSTGSSGSSSFTAGAGSGGPSSPSLRSPRRKAGPRRTASYLPSGADLAFASSGSASSTSIVGGPTAAVERVRAPRLGYSLSFREMLRAIGEVETVLRGCLIECLSRASEWKFSCEDFFSRNQDLLSENIALREGARRGAAEVESLQGALVALQRGLVEASDQRKAILEIQAQAPGAGGGGGGSGGASGGPGGKNAVSGIGLGAAHLYPSHPPTGHRSAASVAAQRRLVGPALAQSGPDHNGLDKALIARHAEPHSTLEGLEAQQRSSGVGSGGGGGGDSRVEQAWSLVEQHRRSKRLSAIDATSPSDLQSLSAADLADLARGSSSSSGGSGAGPRLVQSPRGFFEHHHAMMQCCLAQKKELERMRRAQDSTRGELAQLRAALRQAREARAFPWADGGEGLDREVDAASSSNTTAATTPAERGRGGGTAAHAAAERDGDHRGAELAEEKEWAQSGPHRSARHSGGAPPSSSFPAPSRPSQLDVDEGSNGTRNIRAVIPFSPPVGPVSPFMASPAGGGDGHSRPHSSSGGMASLASSPYAAVRGSGLSVALPPAGGGSGAHSARSSAAPTPRDPGSLSARPHTQTPSRTHSASGGGGGSGGLYSDSKAPPPPHPSARMSPGAAILSASLSTPSQPQGISTSSQSYAATHVYSPAPHVYTPGPHMHSSQTGGASARRRPRTTSGSGRAAERTGASASAAAAEAAAAAALRTVNPLLAAGLVPSSAVAAALVHTKGVALHPALQLTGDVRYDIISPYVATPLPWEPREKRPHTAGSTGTATGAASAPSTVSGPTALPGSSSVNRAAAVAERRRRAQEYGRQVQQQHAAQVAAREEKAQQEAVYERPFQSQQHSDEQNHHANHTRYEHPEHDGRFSSASSSAAASVSTSAASSRPPSSSARVPRPQSASRMRPHPSGSGAAPNGADAPSPVAAVGSSSGESSRVGSSANSSAATTPNGAVSPGRPGRKTPIVPPPQQQSAHAATADATATTQGASSLPGRDSPTSHRSPVTEYRSVRTGGALGYRGGATPIDHGEHSASRSASAQGANGAPPRSNTASAASRGPAATAAAVPAADGYDEGFDTSPSRSRSHSAVQSRPRAPPSAGSQRVASGSVAAAATAAESSDDEPVYTSDSEMDEEDSATR